jgi:hypothetical protein
MRTLLLLASLVSGANGMTWWFGKNPDVVKTSSESTAGAYTESTAGAYTESTAGAYTESTAGAYTESTVGAYNKSSEEESSETSIYTPKTLYIERTIADGVDVVIDAMRIYGESNPSEAAEVTLTIEENPSSEVYTLKVIH